MNRCLVRTAEPLFQLVERAGVWFNLGISEAAICLAQT